MSASFEPGSLVGKSFELFSGFKAFLPTFLVFLVVGIFATIGTII